MPHPNSPLEAVREFVARINTHDREAIHRLQAPDFVFIDAQDRKMEGRDINWDGYFRMFPDYTIRIEDILIKGDTVVILGSYSQTYVPRGKSLKENHLEAPAVWRAEVRNGLISLWQVYTDYTRTFEIINRNKG